MGIQKLNPEMPTQVFSEKQILRDSKIWDYLQYLQLNRINFLTTEIFKERGTTSNQLMNLVSSIDQFEFLVWDKLKKNKEYQRPPLFTNMQEAKPETWQIRAYIDGDAYKQLALKIQATKWLKEMSPALGSMKSIKRVDFVSGEGFIENDNSME